MTPFKSDSNKKIQKAAKILLALGGDVAGGVLRHLDEASQEKLIKEILQIDAIDDLEKEILLTEFKEEVKLASETSMGGKKQAHELLTKALGSRKADQVLNSLESRLPDVSLKELEREYSAKSMSQALKPEQPQIIALALSHLSAPYAAKILKQLAPATSAMVAGKIARLQKIPPETLKSLYHTLKKHLENQEEENFVQPGGENKLSEILKFMDRNSEENLLNNLSIEEPDLADRLKESLVAFEDLIHLSQVEIRKIIERLPDTNVWAIALKGAGQELTRFIFSCVSVNRAQDILTEMEVVGAVHTSDIEYNRKQIIMTAETLDKEKEIILRKDKEEYIE